MARVMFVWELGLGFGHLAPYLELVKALKRKGHVVVFAARDVTNAEKIFGREGVVILQAPLMLRKATNPYKIQYNYAQLVHNNGFSDPQDLLARVKAWLHLYQYVRPDVAIFDHSPTALVAARALKAKRIISGSGFLIPPPGYPLPNMRYWEKFDKAQVQRAENGVLAGVNKVLGAMKIAPLPHMEDLFRADDQFLLGFKELDHYPQRQNGNYLGNFPQLSGGAEPQWPGSAGRRIFAYLYPFKTLPVLLQVLNKFRLRTLIYAPEVPDEFKKKQTTEHVVFSDRPLDMKKAAAQCDAAITSGTYGTTCDMLLAGKPVLMLPQNLERIMVARRVIRVGAGVVAPINRPQLFGPRLRALLTDKRYAEAARGFAKRHAQYNQAWQTEKMLDSIERLAPAASAGAEAAEAPKAG
jgi:UDP:flavonoid glycosyltransferase YjiC (YdhE family)